MTLGEWALLGLLSVLWGGSFFFIEITVDAVPPQALVFLRLGLAAIALHVFLRLSGRRLPGTWRLWGLLVISGAINQVLPWSLLFWAQSHIEGGLASIINAMTPLLTILLAHWMTRDERLTRARAVGVVVGLGGVVALIGPSALSGLGHQVWAQLAVVGTSLCYATGSLYARRFREVPVLTLATGQITGAALLALPIALVSVGPAALVPPDSGTWAALIALSVVSTALAYLIFFRILAGAGATNIVLVTFLVPVSAITLGILFLGETFVLREAVGMALIALGLSILDGRLWQRLPLPFRRRGG